MSFRLKFLVPPLPLTLPLIPLAHLPIIGTKGRYMHYTRIRLLVDTVATTASKDDHM